MIRPVLENVSLGQVRQEVRVPVLLNTSFNENEPIVNTPEEAVECFLRTKMDVLAAGSYVLLKSENPGASENRRASVLAV